MLITIDDEPLPGPLFNTGQCCCSVISSLIKLRQASLNKRLWSCKRCDHNNSFTETTTIL